MKEISIRKEKVFRAFIALFICASFFSFYSVTVSGINLNYKKVGDSRENQPVKQMRPRVRSLNQVSTTESEESSFIGRTMPGSQNNLFDCHFIFSFLYLFIILSLYNLSQNFDGWLVLASQSGCKLMVVDYIQRKDGKKNPNS